MENKKLGMIIRDYRKKAGLKVYELAKKIGVTHVWITKIEKHNDLPSIVVYMNIEKTLKLPPSLRIQYFKEKYPEASEGQLPHKFEQMANSLSANSPLEILQDFTTHQLETPSETKPFIVKIVQTYNPDKTLTEKEIKILTTILKDIIRHNRLMMEKKIYFLEKTHEISKKIV
ncbi:MAG: helix-turn-helix transcriptional regulator [Candidatus Omnitrophica bacterium]|nr:helix-turn-helix transcriptional regulator [Candidatus Omnitrophota bacterium]